VRQLLAFASRQAVQPRVVALDRAVDGMAPLLARLLGRRIPITLDLERPGPCARVDPSHIDQALMNLAVNMVMDHLCNQLLALMQSYFSN